ncbi:MAG: hypothetical protein EHM13_09860 [Acidobacteria bacterium]|nr:MAG: hypothetical protein EHM13_09860 [Acidobacteriota bacterium]
MRRAGTAELKNNLSRYLSYVRAGGEVVVLDRDTPVARLLPFVPADHEQPGGEAGKDDSRGDERMAELERRGVITRGESANVREWLKSHHPVKLPRGSGSVVDAIIEMRDEERR